ncbi:hypothetical protein C8039_02060 [Halogeometricum sp. wsp3]|nr:hypothetical protein C8039_02060 [Halogeometricum sp. wsp3]
MARFERDGKSRTCGPVTTDVMRWPTSNPAIPCMRTGRLNWTTRCRGAIETARITGRDGLFFLSDQDPDELLRERRFVLANNGLLRTPF